MVFRVTRTLAVDFTEMFDVVERDCELTETLVLIVDRLYASQMQHCINEHRGVSVGQHEAVAIRPDRILRIETQETLPQCINHRRQGHRRTRMAGFGLLHGIHRQSTNGVNAGLLKDCVRSVAAI